MKLSKVFFLFATVVIFTSCSNDKALRAKASMLAHLGRMDEAKEILQIYLDLRPEIKSLSDYEKVAPTVIKEVLIDGLRKAGLTE